VIEVLGTELDRTMALTGVRSVKAIDPGTVTAGPPVACSVATDTP